MSRENAQQADGYRRNRLGNTLTLLMGTDQDAGNLLKLGRRQAVMFNQLS